MSASSALSEMYDRYTVAEWMEQKVYPMHSKLVNMRRKGEIMRSIRTWPARPYQPLPELEVDTAATVETHSTKVQAQKHRVQAPDYYSSRRRRKGS